MSYSVELYRSGWNDISNDIIDISDIPYINRNRDFTPIAKPITIIVSSKSSCIPFVYDDLIQVKSDATVIWSGFVSESIYNYESKSYELTVENDLMLLDRTILDVGFPTFSAASFQYDTTGTYPLVNALYLMKQIFTMCGLTLSTSDIDSTTLFIYYFTSYVDVPFNRLCLDVNELRCIGQDSAALYANISLEDEFGENQITGWELIYNLLGNLRLGIVQTSNRNYKLVYPTSNYTISDNVKYKYSNQSYKANTDNISLRAYTTTQVIASGATVTEMALYENEGKGKITTQMLNGLSIRFYNYSGGFVSNASAPTALDPRYKSSLTSFNPVISQIDALTQNYTREEITTDATLTIKTVLENSINIRENTSKIIQEVYELGDELLFNGNMENDNSWTDYNTPNTNEQSTEQANHGTYSRKIEGGSGTSGATSKTFTVTSGNTYRIEAWVYDVDGSASITDSNDRIDFSLVSAGASVWEKLTVDVTATSTGTESIRILCSGTGDVAYFDDISVREFN